MTPPGPEDAASGGDGRPHPVSALGPRLRRVREERRISLREVARQLGVSPSFLSQLETGKSQPSVATLYSLSQLLGVSVDELFTTGDPPSGGPRGPVADPVGDGTGPKEWDRRGPAERLSVTRPGHRARIVMDSGVVWEQLATNTGSQFEFIEIVYPPGSSSTTDGRMLRHHGYECGYLVAGELEVTVGFEVFTLRAGESLGLDSSTPHLFTNRGDVPARGVWFVRHTNP